MTTTSAAEYRVPGIPTLLTVSSFLFLSAISEGILGDVLNAGLLGPLIVGAVFGPFASSILPSSSLSTFTVIGYIGLLLLVFEAGLTTSPAAFRRSLLPALSVALTGVLLPIGLSLLVLHLAFRYTLLQSFSAGAALCSTSLGTTLSLLDSRTRNTPVGNVLVSAALLDDIVGLIIAAVIAQLAPVNANIVSTTPSITWQSIVRPILVSFAFAIFTPPLSIILSYAHSALPRRTLCAIHTHRVQLPLAAAALSGVVAGARYAGTSDLFGAYLVGALLTHVFRPLPSLPTSPAVVTPLSTFAAHISPLLRTILAPSFFASIGAALPLHALGAPRAAWRGVIYSLLMVLAKAAVGGWAWVWPILRDTRSWSDADAEKPADQGPSPPVPTQTRIALLLGLAMVARGEIALVVAQLARPLLGTELFAIAVWAILLTTACGALGVGTVVRACRV